MDRLYELVSLIHDSTFPNTEIAVHGDEVRELSEKLKKMGLTDSQIESELDMRYIQSKTNRAIRSMTK